MTSTYIEYAKHCIGLDHKEPCRRYSKLYYRPYRNYYDASREDCEIWNVMVAAGYAEAGEKDKHGGRMYRMTRNGLNWLGKKLGIVIHDVEEYQMNDRYLYRAKRIDNDEWTYGYLYGIWERKYILWGMTNNVPDMTEVEPSTICQCTGLKDKNGKLIWENDIMVGHLDDKYPENATYVRVMWRNNGFCAHQRYFDDFELLDEFDQNNFEVCGNIFDNPELLELD